MNLVHGEDDSTDQRKCWNCTYIALVLPNVLLLVCTKRFFGKCDEVGFQK